MDRIIGLVFDLLDEYDISVWEDIRYIELADKWVAWVNSGITKDDELKAKLKEFFENRTEEFT